MSQTDQQATSLYRWPPLSPGNDYEEVGAESADVEGEEDVEEY